MKTDKDYQINEENDMGEELAKLVLSRLIQNPDETVNEIIKDVVPTEINEMLRYAFKKYVNETLNKDKEDGKELTREERWSLYVTRFPQMKDNKFKKLINGKWIDSTEEEDMKEYDTFKIPKRR